MDLFPEIDYRNIAIVVSKILTIKNSIKKVIIKTIAKSNYRCVCGEKVQNVLHNL